MHHPSGRTLALVVNRPEAERDPKESRPAPGVDHGLGEVLAHGLEEILRRPEPPHAAAATQPTFPSVATMPRAEGLPFAVRLTMVQILEVAEDTEIRAEILDDVASTLDAAHRSTFIGPVEGPQQIHRRVDSLREVAVELRSIAAALVDRWAGPE